MGAEKYQHSHLRVFNNIYNLFPLSKPTSPEDGEANYNYTTSCLSCLNVGGRERLFGFYSQGSRDTTKQRCRSESC